MTQPLLANLFINCACGGGTRVEEGRSHDKYDDRKERLATKPLAGLHGPIPPSQSYSRFPFDRKKTLSFCVCVCVCVLVCVWAGESIELCSFEA